MNDVLDFVGRYGYQLLFLSVMAEQLAMPVPSLPVLVAFGALAATGEFSLMTGILVGVLACMLSNLLWYGMGRLRGHQILNLLCRISLEPDSCVRRTEDVYDRYGAGALLFAKFVPGLNTAAPPLAGTFGMSLGRFLLFNAGGASLYVCTFILLGFAFSRQLEALLRTSRRLGLGLGLLLLTGLLLYLGIKYLERRRFRGRLKVSRITARELREKIEAGRPVTVIDMRHPLDIEASGVQIPGAVRVEARDLRSQKLALPEEGEVVVYCT